jgi:hypothetical protein
MRKLTAAVLVAAATAAIGPAGSLAARNPSETGTGKPGQSCQEILPPEGTGKVPGRSSSSPGSPFNEPGLGSPEGGVGGAHYSENSQYDVACYQVSQPH